MLRVKWWLIALPCVLGDQSLDWQSADGLKKCEAHNAQLTARVAELENKLRVSATAQGPPVHMAEQLLRPGSPMFVVHCFSALGCVVLAAMAAGLTMGLVSIDPREMDILMAAEPKDVSDDRSRARLLEDKKSARRLIPLIHNHHRLLVTLLLLNSVANEALPIFLDDLVPSWAAVMISVCFVLVFGEIIPSAIFTGSEQLRIAAFFAPFVRCLLCILAPIAVPIGICLDRILGDEHKGRYNFAELRAIVNLHKKSEHVELKKIQFARHDNKGCGIIESVEAHGLAEEDTVKFVSGDKPARSKVLEDGVLYYAQPCIPLSGRDVKKTFKLYTKPSREHKNVLTFNEGDLESGAFEIQERDEIKIMHGVMKLTHMKAEEGHTALRKTYMMDINTPLNLETLKEVFEKGFSRVPVYDKSRHNLRGFIRVKDMIVVSPDTSGKSVKQLGIETPVVIPPNMFMLDLLNKFQEERCHIAFITNDPEGVLEAWQHNNEIPPDVHMLGIITIEDVIEKLLQEDIEDEYDHKIARQLSETSFRVRRQPPRKQITEKHGAPRKDTKDREMSPAKSPIKEESLHEPLLRSQTNLT